MKEIVRHSTYTKSVNTQLVNAIFRNCESVRVRASSCEFGKLSLCAASRMWVRHRSVVMIPLEGGLESRRDSRKRLCFIYVTVKIVLGLTYKIIIESWNTHASSSSQEALLCQAAPRVSREERERSQSVPLTLYQNKMQGVPSRGNIAIRRLPGDSAPLGVINTAVTRAGKEVHSREGDRSARTNPHQKTKIQEKSPKEKTIWVKGPSPSMANHVLNLVNKP